MFCQKCGTELENGVKFCTNCGTPVPGEDEITLEEVSQQEEVVVESANDVPASENEEVESINQEAEDATAASVIYCNNCGSKMSLDDKVCSMCGKPREETFVKKASKFSPKSIITVAVVALLVIFAVSNFAYAKNAVMKMFLSPEKYFAYVVSSNAEDYVDTFTNNFDTAKGYIEKGVGAKTELELKKGKGLEDFLSEIDLDDATEYIDWFKDASMSLDVNTKDSVSNASIGVKLNGVNFGEINTVVDMEDMMTYVGIPEYNSEYVGTSIDTGYNTSDEISESMDMMRDVMNTLPNKGDSKKLMMRYLKVALNSVEDVKEEKRTITADGISQKVTSLSLDIDGKLVKNTTINFLTEIKEDEELAKIIEEIANATGGDTDDLWDDLDYAIEEAKDWDEDYLDTDVTLDIFVNSAGEIVGFEIDAEDGSIETYVAEKGNKFGAFFEVDIDYSGTVRFEGNGKQFNNRKSGEFNLEVMGARIAQFEVKNLNTKKLKKGLFDGSITFKCSDAIDALGYYVGGIDSDVIDILSSLSITVKSSQKSVEDCNCTISLDYEDESIMELKLKGSTGKSKNVKTPSDYVDTYDDYEIQEWGQSFDFNKLIDKMRDAGLPSEIVDELEENIEYMF